MARSPETPAPLLDLDTLTVRPTIRIDGQQYEILSPEEVSVIDSHRFTQWGKRIEELSEQEGAEHELDVLVAQVADRVMVGVPDAVKARLTGTHRLRVVEVFTGLLLGSRMASAAALAKALAQGTVHQTAATTKTPTGDKPFPASSGSTAAPPAGGSGKRQRR